MYHARTQKWKITPAVPCRQHQCQPQLPLFGQLALRGGQGIKERKSNLLAERVGSSFCLVAHGGGSQVARKTIQKESETVSDPESRAIPCSHPAVRLCFRHHARPAACSRAKTKHFDSGYFAVKRDLLHWPPVFASDCCSLQHVLPARSFALRVRQEA